MESTVIEIRFVYTKMSSVTSQSLVEQLKIATAKIEAPWSSEAISPYDTLYAQLTMRLYGDFARGWVWAKNYTSSPTEGSAPGGFQFNVSPRAPLYLRPFSSDALFSGILCYPLAAGECTSLSAKNKQPISFEHFADRDLQIDNQLLTMIDNRKHLGHVSGTVNYAGICWSFENGEHRFYCVVQAHDEDLSRRAYELIEKHEPESFECVTEYARALIAENAALAADIERRRANNNSFELKELAETAEEEIATSSTRRRNSKKAVGTAPDKPPYETWHSLFFQNEEMRAIMRKQEEHRAHVACLTMQASGVGPVVRGKSSIENVRAVLDNKVTVSNTFNSVEQVDCTNRHSDVVYMSNLTSAWSVTSAGVIVRASIDEGFALFRGRLEQPRFAAGGGGDGCSRSAFVGVPVATGPIAAMPPAEMAGAESSRTVLWSASRERHPMLAPANWRVRSSAPWIDWERGCGLARDPIILKPSRLRMADPVSPVLPSSATIYRTTQ